MKCPKCSTALEVNADVDICERGNEDGVEVFFTCPACLVFMAATVMPDHFYEVDPEEEP